MDYGPLIEQVLIRKILHLEYYIFFIFDLKCISFKSLEKQATTLTLELKQDKILINFILIQFIPLAGFVGKEWQSKFQLSFCE